MSLMLSDDEELIRDHGGPGDASERQELLGNQHDDDDDFFLNGPQVGRNMRDPEGKLGSLRKQVEDVTEAMSANVRQMMDRGDRLDDLQMRSERLNEAGTEFRDGSFRIQRKMWWENTKAKMIAGGTAVTVLVVIIIIALG